LRDAAALVSLASEGNATAGDADAGGRARRSGARADCLPHLDQENAWLVLASRALAKETLTLDIEARAVKTALYRSYQGGPSGGVKAIKTHQHRRCRGASVVSSERRAG